MLLLLGVVATTPSTVGAEPLLTVASGMAIIDVAELDGMVLAAIEPGMAVFAPVGSHVEGDVVSEDGVLVGRSSVTSDETKIRSQGWTDDVVMSMLDKVRAGGSAVPVLASASTQRAAGPGSDLEGTLRACQTMEHPGFALRGCAFFDDGDTTSSGRYLADSTWAAGRGDDGFDLTRMNTRHTWSNHSNIVRYSPTETINKGACESYTVGVSFANASLSETQTICPEYLDPNPLGEKTFETLWAGRTTGTRYVEQASVSLIPVADAPSGFAHEISGRAEPRSLCGSGTACDILVLIFG